MTFPTRAGQEATKLGLKILHGEPVPRGLIIPSEYIAPKDAAKFALDKISAALGADVADALTLDHLQGAYIAMAGGKEGADTKRAVIDVESKAEIEAHEAKADDEAQEDAAAAPDAKTLTESLYQAIGAGNMPKDNPALKKLVEAFDGKPADPARMKQAQEELETAIAMSARDIVAKGQNDKATFDELLRLYESQPSLNIRTSTSVANLVQNADAALYQAKRNGRNRVEVLR